MNNNMTSLSAAQKFSNEIAKFDKVKIWENGNLCRVYVGKRGRYVEFVDGVADVSGMIIHQAQNGAIACCERAGVSVLENE